MRSHEASFSGAANARRPVFTISGVSLMRALETANAAGINQQIIVALQQDHCLLSQYIPYASSTPARRDAPCGFIGIHDQAAAGQVDLGHPIILQLKKAPEAKQVATAAKAAAKKDSRLG